jgi:hypothetical protein
MNMRYSVYRNRRLEGTGTRGEQVRNSRNKRYVGTGTVGTLRRRGTKGTREQEFNRYRQGRQARTGT